MTTKATPNGQTQSDQPSALPLSAEEIQQIRARFDRYRAGGWSYVPPTERAWDGYVPAGREFYAEAANDIPRLLATMDAERTLREQTQQELDRLRSARPTPEPTLREALEQNVRLREAIEWALGERDEFPPEPPPLAGKYRQRYWWRSELRRRAALASVSPPPQTKRPQCENFTPPEFTGPWRDWHRGHGCNLDPSPPPQEGQ